MLTLISIGGNGSKISVSDVRNSSLYDATEGERERVTEADTGEVPNV